MSLKNEQLRQALRMFTTQMDILAEPAKCELEKELVSLLDDNLPDRMKIRLSGEWIDIGDGMEEGVDEQP